MLLLLALTPSFAADEFGDYAYYYGDVHVHTGVSGDAGSSDLGCIGDCGAYADVYQSARDNGLDFMALTDHSNGRTAVSSESGMVDNFALSASELDEAGGFITIPGAEVWLEVAGTKMGHRTLLMFADDASLSGITLADLQPAGSSSVDVGSCGAYETWATDLAATWGSILLLPHHPAVKIPSWTDWTCFQAEFEPVVEVYSEHGNSLGDGTGYDDVWSGEYPGSTVHEAIDPDGLGLQMGFVAGTDKHNSRGGDVCSLDTELTSHPYGGGLTVVAVPKDESFNRTAIYDAMMDRRTLATTGPMMPVDIQFESGGAALAGLGESVGLPSGQELDVTVAIPADLVPYVIDVVVVTPDTRVTMDALGEGEWSTTLDSTEAVGWVYAAVEIDGDLWYGSSGCDDGGADTLEYVWTSPGYITAVSGDLDGDGVTVADGDCDDGDASLYAGAEEITGDGIDQDCDGSDPVEGIFDTGAAALEEDLGDTGVVELVEGIFDTGVVIFAADSTDTAEPAESEAAEPDAAEVVSEDTGDDAEPAAEPAPEAAAEAAAPAVDPYLKMKKIAAGIRARGWWARRR